MKRKLEFSAKFKRDYIAALAVVIFFAIVAAEIALAVSIPMYLHRENAMAHQVRRLRLLESFDSARNMCRTAPAGETAEMELRLISWNLNLLANYLRDYSGVITSNEITSIQDSVNAMNRMIVRIKSNRAYSKENRLNSSLYINSLLHKSQSEDGK